MSFQYQRAVRMFEAKGVAQATSDIKSLFEAGEIKPQDIDLGRLFEECFGSAAFKDCRNRSTTVAEVMGRALTEAQGAVTTAAFQNISGQFMFTNVLAAYENEDFVFSRMIPEAQASTLDGEKVPGITPIGDEVAVRAETEPYAIAGVGESWIFTPPILDRGVVIPVTFEAIFNDKTGQLISQCSQVGEAAGLNREKRAIDCFIDENGGAVTGGHRYNWRGTTIATYGDNSGTHTWDNLQASSALVDWTQVNTAEQLFNGLLNPFTGEPIVIEAKHLVVTKSLEQTARRIVSATEIVATTPGFATSANPMQAMQSNPYLNKYTVVTSRQLAARLATDTSWWIADISKYAKYMVAERMNVVAAPPNSSEEFHRRIVQSYRVNERGAYIVVEPRASVKSTA